MSDDTSKQLNDMTSGLDNLKDSLKEINKAVPEFTDGMQSGLKAVAKVLSLISNKFGNNIVVDYIY